MSQKLSQLLQQYYEKFHDSIPIMFTGWSEDQAIEIITKCIKTGEPYKIDFKKNTIL